MRLPNADQVVIRDDKIRAYLLDPSGRSPSKARLFAALGYTQDNWEVFGRDLRAQHLSQDAIELAPGDFGWIWKIEAQLTGPKGSANIRSIWIIPFDTGIPELVSAYRV